MSARALHWPKHTRFRGNCAHYIQAKLPNLIRFSLSIFRQNVISNIFFVVNCLYTYSQVFAVFAANLKFDSFHIFLGICIYIGKWFAVRKRGGEHRNIILYMKRYHWPTEYI